MSDTYADGHIHHINQWPFRHDPSTGPSVVKTASAPPQNDLRGLVSRIGHAAQSWSVAGGQSKTAAFGQETRTKPVTMRNIWVHHDASPMALMLILLDRYGEDLFEWEPETLKLTIDRELREPSNSVWTKILAARTIIHSPSPWRQWEVFHWCALGLSGSSPNFHYMEEPEIGHLLAGMDFMNTVDPERETQEEVDKFIAVAFKQEGIVYLPELFSEAREQLEEPMLECQDCGNKFEDDLDLRCISCASTKLTKIPYEHADARDETKRLFEERKGLDLKTAVKTLPETASGNSAYHLLVHWDHLKTTRTHTVQQLRMIGNET